MRVAVVAHIRHPIAEPFQGGMEAHCHRLVRGLMARGHDVKLFASGDSDPTLPLYPIVAEHYDRDYPWAEHVGSARLNALQDAAYGGCLAALRAGGFDVVHNNSLHRYLPRAARALGLPMVTSLHVPPFDVLERAVTDGLAPWGRVTVTSRAHGAMWWPGVLPDGVEVVGNGIDLTAWPYRAEGNGRAAWVGRVHPNKGLHVAAEAAALSGIPLDIYGVMEDRAYFDAEVAPHLSERIVYHGALDSEALAARLGAASVLAFTPLWPEPFGLVAAEAMACGVPVAALPNGAAAEVVGAGGALAEDDTAEGLATAMQAAARIPRGLVRAEAEQRHGEDRMLAGYEGAYDRAIAARPQAMVPARYAAIEFPTAA
ncbi:MAG: glycosyltransferase [Shimia sp.]